LDLGNFTYKDGESWGGKISGDGDATGPNISKASPFGMACFLETFFDRAMSAFYMRPLPGINSLVQHGAEHNPI
jgi:hypothetical protein